MLSQRTWRLCLADLAGDLQNGDAGIQSVVPGRSGGRKSRGEAGAAR
jgi:hypothetical protein